MKSIHPKPERKERSLEHVAGVTQYIDAGDSRQRAFGVKSFRLRDLWYFNALLQRAMAVQASSVHDAVKRAAWIVFLQECTECHDVRPSLSIRLRRALGLPDYSRRSVGRIVKFSPPPAACAVLYANYEFKDFEEMAASVSDNAKKSGAEKEKKRGGDDDDVFTMADTLAAFTLHKNITPDAFLDMTMPQINAVCEYAAYEDWKNNRKTQADALRTQTDQWFAEQGIMPRTPRR